MQINLSANMPNPAGETNVKPADFPEAGSSDGFHAQMNQILGQGNEGSGLRENVENSRSASNSARKNPADLANDSLQNSSRIRHAKKTPAQSGPETKSRRIEDQKSTDTTQPAVGDPHKTAEKKHSTTLAGNMADCQDAPSGDEDGIENLIPASKSSDNPAPAGQNRQPVFALELNGIALRTSHPQTDSGTDQPTGTGEKLVSARAFSLPPISGQADSGNDTATFTAAQDTVKGSQLNLDFGSVIASKLQQSQKSGNSESPEAGSGHIRILSGEDESENDMSPTALLSKSLKSTQARQERAETANTSADQGQTPDRSASSMPLIQKTEQAALHLMQPPLVATERQSQAQAVVALNPTQTGESSGAVDAPAEPSSTSKTPEFILQMADQIQIQLRDGKGEIRIQLKPDGFGRLEISAENTIHGVSARISTESSTVKSYLENNLQLLQQTLQDQGLKIDRIHIVVQDAMDAQSSSGFSAQFGQTGSGQNGKDPHLSSAKPGTSPADAMEEGSLDPASWLALNPNNRFYTVA